MQVCTLLRTDNHASTPPLSFFTGRMPFLPPNQQRQSTEGSNVAIHYTVIQESWHKLSLETGALCSHHHVIQTANISVK